MDRALVIKLRNIGDVLLSSALFRALKQARPGLWTSALVPAGTEDMLTGNPDVDEVITTTRGGFVEGARLLKRLRSRRYDLAINMTEGDRGAVLAFASGAPCRIGVDPAGKGFIGKARLFSRVVRLVEDGRHKALIDMDLLGPLGIRPDGAHVGLFTSRAQDARVEKMLRDAGVGPGAPLAVVHPTSRWLFKCWRDEAVAEVIDYLEGRGMRVALTSGPDGRELEKAHGILSLAKPGPLDLAGMLTLKELAALLKRSTLFFGVDTAPMHMAAALGVPVVALFGPSDHRTWGPLSDRARVVRASGFDCMPCRRDGCGGSKKSACLEAIGVDDAVRAIEGLVGGGR